MERVGGRIDRINQKNRYEIGNHHRRFPMSPTLILFTAHLQSMAHLEYAIEANFYESENGHLPFGSAPIIRGHSHVPNVKRLRQLNLIPLERFLKLK